MLVCWLRHEARLSTTPYSLAARAVNLAMFGNNNFIAFPARYYPINEISAATRLAFSESKMAAKMAAVYI